MTNSNNILHINSSGRIEGSITRQLSQLVVQQIVQQLNAAESDLEVVSRDLATGLPFVDEQWINANFTSADQRDDTQQEILGYSDRLVSELQNAQHIVIATPIYNFSIPAVLKAWIDMIARVQLTFRYTENGPEGLLSGKKAYIAIASGGVVIGSEMDFASKYLRQVLGFIGIIDVIIIDASTINLAADDGLKSATTQIDELLFA